MAAEHDIQLISRNELKEKIDSDEDFELIEVLSEDQFSDFHLPGAINIPGDELRSRTPERIPDKDREIVVYCASPSCEASPRAARLLMDMGYTHVKDYAGGKEHWREGRLPVEAGEPQPA